MLGRVTVGRNAWLGALSVMRADGHFVRVGDDFHLGARSTLHINHEIFPCIVGDRVSVGRNACVHACTVGSDVVVGDEVVILDGATVDDNVVLEPGATVFPNKTVPGGFVYAGSPAKPVRPLEPARWRSGGPRWRGSTRASPLRFRAPPSPRLRRFIRRSSSPARRA